MNKRPDPDLKRDAVLYGDLLNLAKLKELQSPTEDDVRLHAAAVRRLLLEGELATAAGRRRLALLFYPTDSNPLVRAARNHRAIAFCLWGVTVFGVQFSGAFLNAGNLPPNEEFHPDTRVCLKLDAFLKQTVAMSPPLVLRSTSQPPRELSPSLLLSRQDVLHYISNKIGGVHYDPSPKGRHLTEEKMHALGRMRRVFHIGIEDGIPGSECNIESMEEEQSSTFKYEPEKIDAIYLEFIATIELILGSPEITELRESIASDLKVS
jgi:hypothetical protein